LPRRIIGVADGYRVGGNERVGSYGSDVRRVAREADEVDAIVDVVDVVAAAAAEVRASPSAATVVVVEALRVREPVSEVSDTELRWEERRRVREPPGGDGERERERASADVGESSHAM
jgi:hypothetical protein